MGEVGDDEAEEFGDDRWNKPDCASPQFGLLDKTRLGDALWFCREGFLDLHVKILNLLKTEH